MNQIRVLKVRAREKTQIRLHTPTRQHVVLVLVFTHRYYTNRAEYFPCLFFAIVFVSISADLFHHDK